MDPEVSTGVVHSLIPFVRHSLPEGFGSVAKMGAWNETRKERRPSASKGLPLRLRWIWVYVLSRSRCFCSSIYPTGTTGPDVVAPAYLPVSKTSPSVSGKVYDWIPEHVEGVVGARGRVSSFWHVKIECAASAASSEVR